MDVVSLGLQARELAALVWKMVNIVGPILVTGDGPVFGPKHPGAGCTKDC